MALKCLPSMNSSPILQTQQLILLSVIHSETQYVKAIYKHQLELHQDHMCD